MRKLYLLLVMLLGLSCSGKDRSVQPGAGNVDAYLDLLSGKRIGIVANHTSLLEGVHLVDTLVALSSSGNFEICRIFSPEHGFRGTADAGEEVGNKVDGKTGIPVISLYGKNKKPAAEQLESLDLVIFDIQDIGVRFYTYISTLHYVMEACAENNIPLILLDRPNPNGNYVDGPVLQIEFSSFVGMHPIPVVYGLTMGELAGMINGEGWLHGGVRCDLTVIPNVNYTHSSEYALPVKPSPNLPNQHSIRIYPSTCFFEGTVISEGRGTLFPFEVYGHPDLEGDFSFTPESIAGMSMSPKLKGEQCFGTDLRNFEPHDGWNSIELKWLLNAYNIFPEKDKFFLPYFEKLAGTDLLRKQIVSGLSEAEIRESWKPDIDAYMLMRSKYLRYPE